MNNKMNRVVFIPVITLLVLMIALTPVSAATVDRISTRGASGRWELVIGDEDIVIEVDVLDESEPTREISIYMGIFFEEDPPNEFDKILVPSEFTWSIGACRVSTEIYVIGEENFTLPITVEWDTYPPTLKERVVETINGVRVISTSISREGVATLTTIEYPGGPLETYPGGDGEVWETTSITITR